MKVAYKLKLGFSFEKELVLPKHYNHTLQGFFYENMDRMLSRFFHDIGFPYNNRTFKLFTFSNIIGNLKAEYQNQIVYEPPNMYIYFSTPVIGTMKSIVNRVIRNDRLRLSKNIINLSEIEITEEPIDQDEIKIECLSPIVVYRTPIGSKRHIYFSPFENEFYELLRINILKKYRIIYGRDYDGDFEITPAKVKKEYMRKVFFDKTFIIGYDGQFYIRADKDMLKVALECGLGVKNSAGFGCIMKV